MSAVCLVCMLVCGQTPADVVDQEIRVGTKSGRQFHARVHSRSNSSQLWLEFTGASTRILRPLNWEAVESIRLSGEELDPDTLREMLTASEGATSSNQISEQNESPIQGNRSSRTTLQIIGERVPSSRLAQMALGEMPSVASVTFDAELANWDNDVQADGLVMTVFPLDEYGDVRPVSGTLVVTLSGPVAKATQDAPGSRGVKIERIGRWSRSLNFTTFGQSGCAIKLPFQAKHPEFDTNIGPHAFVHVRLTVPGQGVYEDTFDDVRIRRYSPNRDLLQRSTGHRFQAFEKGSRIESR